MFLSSYSIFKLFFSPRLYASSMAAAPELLKVVNLIMKRQSAQNHDADSLNEKQYRKMAEIDIDDKVCMIKIINVVRNSILPKRFLSNRLKHVNAAVNYRVN